VLAHPALSVFNTLGPIVQNIMLFFVSLAKIRGFVTISRCRLVAAARDCVIDLSTFTGN